ncbi:YidH family protein [Novosphingobium guangzhouense]|uniref:DUF202 domain-containing protein n=1 Tax=Novosphingobium guangzhouense TaxID=1850347 RepID=A0A2K2FZ03_9SPHN|nr:DUF202 domain-containing protein [Novosphingobium guangzhouense]PNU04017.1 hypothetical protein A8V01_05215 [Novosphingobium guangzhouense]
MEPIRPERVVPETVPDLPQIAAEEASQASTIYSRFRTGLSRRRTGLSEHRTDLSEFRTDLSEHRTELGMRRTGMAIQRTRMAADRTLMAELRTSLSMIGFGFTIYETFRSLAKADMLTGSHAPRNFGLALILLGMLILAGGIWRHIQFANELRRRRLELTEQGLIHGESAYPISVSLVVALGLLLVGCVAAANIIFGLTLFGS